LYDLLKPHVTKVVVCNPRKNALLKAGNKSDRIDARKLAELLRGGLLSAVYHGETGLRTLKELSRSYLAISKDLARTMNRVKALYRSWSIPCGGASVYAPRHRAEWLSKITEPGVRRRAELFYQQLDGLQKLRQEARRDLLAESRKHGATSLLQRIPYIGPIRAALLIALMQMPHRFRTKRQLWAYSGLALETHSSGEYHYVQGQLQRWSGGTRTGPMGGIQFHQLATAAIPIAPPNRRIWRGAGRSGSVWNRTTPGSRHASLETFEGSASLLGWSRPDRQIAAGAHRDDRHGRGLRSTPFRLLHSPLSVFPACPAPHRSEKCLFERGVECTKAFHPVPPGHLLVGLNARRVLSNMSSPRAHRFAHLLTANM